MITDSDNRRIEYVTLAELVTRLHPRNPKQHDIGAIIESYRNHGFVASGVLDDRTGLFLAGHGRIEALNMMRKQGMEAPRGIQNGGDDWLVPVQVGYESENDSAAMAYLAADNKLTELGGWNEPALAELLQEVHNSGEIALEATGFDADGLDELLYQLNPLNAYDEWEGMPEFEQEGIKAYQSIIVHFNTRQDVEQFSALIGQSLTEKTKWIYHPKQNAENLKGYFVADES
jgi:hypothetical protein